MKVSIITLHFVKNYGSVLQTYATQELLKSLGYEAEVVDYWQPRYLDKNILEGNLLFAPKWNKNAITRTAYKLMKYPSHPRMCRVFNDFLAKYINLTQMKYTTLRQLQENPPQADFYMTGSDQVWNTTGNDCINRMYYLDYAPEGKKRIAYAASFGRSQLGEWEKAETRELLQKYDSIAMRESSGVEIVHELGMTAVNLIDPTLMLNGDQWSKLIDKDRFKARDYIFVYMLKGTAQSDEYISRVAKKHGLKVIRLGYGYHEMLKNGDTVVLPPVYEFLSLIKNARCVITNSFHATAFSINFNTPFISVMRERANSRINDLLRLLNLEDRRLTDFNDLDLMDKAIDFEKVNDLLNEQREVALKYLKDSLR